jgi:hypothetical protein
MDVSSTMVTIPPRHRCSDGAIRSASEPLMRCSAMQLWYISLRIATAVPRLQEPSTPGPAALPRTPLLAIFRSAADPLCSSYNYREIMLDL